VAGRFTRAAKESKTLVRADAIEALRKYKKDISGELFLKSINDSSYSIAGNVLFAPGSKDFAALYFSNIQASTSYHRPL
jgi:hypothetical protein